MFHTTNRTMFYISIISLASGTEAQVLQIILIKLRGSSVEVHGTVSQNFHLKIEPIMIEMSTSFISTEKSSRHIDNYRHR